MDQDLNKDNDNLVKAKESFELQILKFKDILQKHIDEKSDEKIISKTESYINKMEAHIKRLEKTISKSNKFINESK